jgi:hypothetical protein
VRFEDLFETEQHKLYAAECKRMAALADCLAKSVRPTANQADTARLLLSGRLRRILLLNSSPRVGSWAAHWH